MGAINKISQFAFPDVNLHNEVYYIDLSRFEGWPKIGVSSFLTTSRSESSLLAALEHVVRLLSRSPRDYGYWVCIASDCVQPDTRIVRYRGLLGSLKSRGLEIPDNILFKEKLIVLDSGIKFFSEFELKPELMRFAVSLMLNITSSYIVAVPKDFKTENFDLCDIDGSLREDFHKFEFVFRCGGALIARLGFFDDDESGFLVLASPELVMDL